MTWWGSVTNYWHFSSRERRQARRAMRTAGPIDSEGVNQAAIGWATWSIIGTFVIAAILLGFALWFALQGRQQSIVLFVFAGLSAYQSVRIWRRRAEFREMMVERRV